MDVAATDLMAPACDILRGTSVTTPVVFASPHSGALYPDDLTDNLQVPLMDLRRTEDAFVDDLFASAPERGSVLIAANYARAYVDLNRDARELDPTMFRNGSPRQAGLPGARVKAGLGSLPRIGAGGQDIYARKLCRSDGARRLDLIHDVYHQTLHDELQSLKQSWPEAILIDCHSMPSVQPGRPREADIVLGDRFGSSCTSKLTGLVERAFRREGWSVSRNAPYAGGYTTRRYGRPRRGTHVLQIEINRGLYMNERDVRKTASFNAVKSVIEAVMQDIIMFASREFA